MNEEAVASEQNSWLSDIEHVCVYKCEHGHTSAWAGKWDDKPETINCGEDDCNSVSSYAYFEPLRLGGFQKIAYTQNGRQAYMIKDPTTGKVQYRSKAKDYFLESGGKTREFYTNDFKEKKRDQEEVNKRRANVVAAKAAEYAQSLRKK